MDHTTHFILQIEGFEHRGQSPQERKNNQPFIEETPFNDLRSAFATALSIPFKFLDENVSRQQNMDFNVHKVSIKRNDELLMATLQSSRKAHMQRSLAFPGIYLFVRNPARFEQLAKIQIEGKLHSPLNNGTYLLASTSNVGGKLDLGLTDGFKRLFEEIKADIQPTRFVSIQESSQQQLRRMATDRAMKTDMRSIKKTFGPK